MTDLRAQLIWSRTSVEGELEELAARLGVGHELYSALGLKVNGSRVVISVDHKQQWDRYREIKDDILDAVNVTVKFERAGDSERTRKEDEALPAEDAPSIELRRETATDRADKKEGLTREVQTGFAGFDRLVFVDNDSTDADALRVLSKEATRQAVLRLLERPQIHSVQLSTTGATFRFQVKDAWIDSGAVLEALEDLLVVARAGGPKAARPERKGETLTVLSVGTALVAVVFMLFMWFIFHVNYMPILLGVVIGGGVGLAMRGLLERHVAGDSGSGGRSRLLTITVALTLAGFLGGTLALINCGLDDEKPVVRKGIVTHVREKKGKNGGQYIEVRFPEGPVELYHPGFVRTGMTYFENHHPGALGFAWTDGFDVQ